MLAFLEEQPAAAYDVVFSAYAFQYVENLAAVFRRARRVLRPGGLFVFSLDHPLNDVVSMEHGKPVLSRSYFARGRMDWNWDYPADGFIVPFYSFHRTVGDFLSMLVEAGFIVERLLEPEPVDETDAWIPPEEFERYAMVPATIIWKARVPERAER
jgi:SAM-dependent methyltransferase